MSTLAVLVIGALVAAANVVSQTTTQCASGLKMFVARGTGEPMGTGELGKLVSVIANQIPGSDIQAIEYPATDDNPLYFKSVANGTNLVRQKITDYSRGCPKSKMALFGWSQGAQIFTNNLCGTPTGQAAYGLPPDPDTNSTGKVNATMLQELTKPLPQELTKNIVSIILLADPTQPANASYARGNSTGGSGIFHRGNNSACEALGPRLRSYCDAGDPYCDEGGKAPVSLTAHMSYLIVHDTEIVKAVVDLYRSAGGAVSNSTSAAPTGTPTNAVASAAAGLSCVPFLALAAMILMLVL